MHLIKFVFSLLIICVSQPFVRSNLFDGLKRKQPDDDHKWCGLGVIAEDARTACCREHASCTDVIDGKTTSQGLFNPGSRRRYSCTCEGRFMQCLKGANTEEAIVVGNEYFNTMSPKCFMLQYPIIGCLKYRLHPTKKCLINEVDSSLLPKLQWMDVPEF